MFFKDVIGQQQVKKRLINTVTDQRISHAQLFSGSAGSGKLGLAIAYAQYISCTMRSDSDSCGTCPSCRKYAKLAHPDLHFVFPVFKPSGSGKLVYCDEFLPQWREQLLSTHYFGLQQWGTKLGADNAQLTIYAHESEAILKKLNSKPFESDFKIMVIWLPEKMNIACANKLLKLIEEPPPFTILLLVTDNEAEILATIRSRTQLIAIPRIADNDLQDSLVAEGLYDPSLVAGMVRHGRGDYLRALEFAMPGEDKQYFFEVFQTMMRKAYVANKNTALIPELLDLAEELAAIGRERQKEFFQYAMVMTREFFMLNLQNPALVSLNKSESEFGSKFSPFINERNVALFNELFEAGHLHISRNGNPKIVFADVLLSIIRIIRK